MLRLKNIAKSIAGNWNLLTASMTAVLQPCLCCLNEVVKGLSGSLGGLQDGGLAKSQKFILAV